MQSRLYHHGIKGQRWGIRRFQNKDGTLTPAGKKHYKDDDITFSKGYAQSHISSQNKIKMKNRSTFTMINENDAKVYSGAYGMYLVDKQKRMGKDPKVYAHVFENKHSGVIAGEKAMRDTFNSIYENHKDLVVSAMARDYNEYAKNGQIKSGTSYKDFSKDKDRMFKLFTKVTLDYYSVADSSGELKDFPSKNYILGKMYTENLQKQKYSGMLDLNDKGSFFGVESPVIIFNGKKYLKDSHVTELPLSAVEKVANTLLDEGKKSTQRTERI